MWAAVEEGNELTLLRQHVLFCEGEKLGRGRTSGRRQVRFPINLGSLTLRENREREEDRAQGVREENGNNILLHSDKSKMKTRKTLKKTGASPRTETKREQRKEERGLGKVPKVMWPTSSPILMTRRSFFL